MIKRVWLIISLLTALSFVACDWFHEESEVLVPVQEESESLVQEESEVLVQELTFTVDPPEVSGDMSLINITGSVEGEALSMSWDFSDVTGGFTNGLMSVQISSSLSGTASLYFDNDFSSSSGTRPQGEDEWYLRFTLGNASPSYTVYNSMETFSIPVAPYSLITLRKGPHGVEYRNRYYNSENLMSGVLSSAQYDENANTLRLKGSLRSVWGDNWVQADFNVLIGGADDRQASSNSSSMEFSYE